MTLRITRRHFVLGAAGAATLTGIAAFAEPLRVTIERHRITSPGATPSTPVLRLVQLSDLHLQEFDAHARSIVDTVNSLRPDILLLTGDAIDDRSKLGVLHAFLGSLNSASLKLAILGNWEHWAGVDLSELREAYSRHECRLLVNERQELDVAGTRVSITGLDDSTGGRPDATVLGDEPGTPNHIVLAHSPAFRDILTALFADHDARISRSVVCLLSGHTHGGQVNLFGWAPFTPPGSGRYVSGWYRDEGLPMYVSRGLGTSVAPIRLGSPPEVSFFEWHTAAA